MSVKLKHPPPPSESLLESLSLRGTARGGCYEQYALKLPHVRLTERGGGKAPEGLSPSVSTKASLSSLSFRMHTKGLMQQHSGRTELGVGPKVTEREREREREREERERERLKLKLLRSKTARGSKHRGSQVSKVSRPLNKRERLLDERDLDRSPRLAGLCRNSVRCALCSLLSLSETLPLRVTAACPWEVGKVDPKSLSVSVYCTWRAFGIRR